MAKRILLIVTASISAYKACDLVRKMIHAGYIVDVMISEAATQFVSPLTFEALSHNHVSFSQFHDAAAPSPHVELTQNADLVVVYPATANTIAKMAHGIADTLVSTTLLASDSNKTLLFPAMNPRMYEDAATQDNISLLKQRGVRFFGPIDALVADGEQGAGHILDVYEAFGLVNAATKIEQNVLSGKTVMVSAGATRESIDPIRFLSNRSSGKMALSLVYALLAAGAHVIVLKGFSEVGFPKLAEIINTESAKSMLDAALNNAQRADAFVSVAAVSDLSPKSSSTQKLKKGSTLTSELSCKENPDILKEVRKHYPSLFTIGFAAETEDSITYAKAKQKAKGTNLFVATDVSEKGSGFGEERLKATLVSDTEQTSFGNISKSDLAATLVSTISNNLR